MQNGVPVIGVIDNEGYRVGRFSNGDIAGSAELEPQDRLDAFPCRGKGSAGSRRLLCQRGQLRVVPPL